MKKISAFRSKGGMKFLFSSLFVIALAVIFVLEQKKISDLLFAGTMTYNIIILLYYKFMD